MKLNMIRAVCVLLIVAGLGLYIYGVTVNNEPFTENLGRTLIIVLSGVSALIKLTPKRRPLSDLATAYAKELGNAFADDPKKREALLGALRLFNEDKYPAAIKALDALRMEACTRDEIYAVGLFTALCQEGLGLKEAAAATYEETAAKGAPSGQLYSNLGLLYASMDEPIRAGEALLQAIKLDPENPVAHNNMANLLLRMGEYDDAGLAASNAIRLNPNQYQAWTVMAVVAGVKGDEEHMEKCVRKAVELGQDEGALRRAITHYVNIAEQDAQEAAEEA